MTAHVTNDAMFELPDVGFVDRTTHELDVPLGAGDSLTMLVLRAPLARPEALADDVRAHVIREATRLAGHRLVAQGEATVDGRPAIDVAARWRHDGAELYTRELHVAAGGTRVVIAITAPIAHRATCDDHLAHVATSFRFT